MFLSLFISLHKSLDASSLPSTVSSKPGAFDPCQPAGGDDSRWSLLYSAVLHPSADSLRLRDSAWMTSFYSMFHRSAVLTALAWLVLYETAAVSPCSVQPCTVHFMQSHVCKVHVCLAVTCHRHFWQNDESFMCYCGNTGVECILKYESAQTVDLGKENSSVAHAGLQTCNLSITSPAL